MVYRRNSRTLSQTAGFASARPPLAAACVASPLCAPSSAPAEQGIMLALALTEQYPGVALRGGWRVHGGGFAGTMLAILPGDLVQGYRAAMEAVFGQGSVAVLTARHAGAVSWRA